MQLSPRKTGLLIFAAALALRAGWIAWSWQREASDSPAAGVLATAERLLKYDDERLHWQLASNFVRNGSLVSDDGRYAARMPLYPLFLAPFAALGEWGIFAARLVQAVLGAAVALVVYRFGRIALDERVAIAGGLLAAGDPHLVFFSNLLLTEVPFTFIGVGLTASAWHLLGGTGGRWPALGTALLGSAAVMMRPSAAGWVLLLWVMIGCYAVRRRRLLWSLALCAGAMVVALLPWGLRNCAVLGSCAWLSANGGASLYDGQGPQARGDSDQSFLRDDPTLRGLGEVELDRTLRQRAFEQMRRDPGRAVRLAGVKFLRTWSLTPNVAEFHGGAVAAVSAAFTLPVLIAAAVGVYRLRRRWLLLGLLWLPVVYFTFVHCVYVGSLRYRLPVMPFVELTAAAAVIGSTRRLKPALPV